VSDCDTERVADCMNERNVSLLVRFDIGTDKEMVELNLVILSVLFPVSSLFGVPLSLLDKKQTIEWAHLEDKFLCLCLPYCNHSLYWGATLAPSSPLFLFSFPPNFSVRVHLIPKSTRRSPDLFKASPNEKR